VNPGARAPASTATRQAYGLDADDFRLAVGAGAGAGARGIRAGAVRRSGRFRSRLGGAVGAVLDRQPDRGSTLAVDLDVGEGRDAHQVDVGRRQVAASNGNGLDRLVEGPRPHDLYLDRIRLAHDAGHGASYRVRVGSARNLEDLHRPSQWGGLSL